MGQRPFPRTRLFLKHSAQDGLSHLLYSVLHIPLLIGRFFEKYVLAASALLTLTMSSALLDLCASHDYLSSVLQSVIQVLAGKSAERFYCIIRRVLHLALCQSACHTTEVASLVRSLDSGYHSKS